MWSIGINSILSTTAVVAAQNIASCPGYSISNIQQTVSGLTAELFLAGDACNVYGADLPNLTLTVEYQSSESVISDWLIDTYSFSESHTCTH